MSTWLCGKFLGIAKWRRWAFSTIRRNWSVSNAHLKSQLHRIKASLLFPAIHGTLQLTLSEFHNQALAGAYQSFQMPTTLKIVEIFAQLVAIIPLEIFSNKPFSILRASQFPRTASEINQNQGLSFFLNFNVVWKNSSQKNPDFRAHNDSPSSRDCVSAS